MDFEGGFEEDFVGVEVVGVVGNEDEGVFGDDAAAAVGVNGGDKITPLDSLPPDAAAVLIFFEIFEADEEVDLGKAAEDGFVGDDGRDLETGVGARLAKDEAVHEAGDAFFVSSDDGGARPREMGFNGVEVLMAVGDFSSFFELSKFLSGATGGLVEAPGSLADVF